MDAALVLSLHDWTSSQPAVAGLVSAVAEFGIFLLPVAVVLVWLRSASADAANGPRTAVVVGCVAAVVAAALGLLLEHLLSRPRPFVALGFSPLVPHAADTSFPSDHTLVGVALVGPQLWRGARMGVWLFGWALLVGAARMTAGVHYPTDIVGSAVLALGVDALVWVALRPVLKGLNLQLWDARLPGTRRGARR